MNGIFDLVVTDVNNDKKPDIVAIAWNVLMPPSFPRVFMNCNTVGLDETLQKMWDVETFPNPARDYIELRMNDEDPSSSFNSISIYNDLGQIVRQEEFSPAENKGILTHDLETGIYFVQLRSSKGEIVSKRVVVTP